MVTLKTQEELDLMERANRIVLEVLASLERRLRAGVTTRELDAHAEASIRERGGRPAFLGYRGFPATLCTSVNDVIVHGIPNDVPLEDGDIVSIDCGVEFSGYYGDAARTYRVGAVSEQAARLLEVTRRALDVALDCVAPGRWLHDIGRAVERYVKDRGFSVVRDFVGHGIGSALHEEPEVPNYRRRGRGIELRSGMVLAIEPMVNAGSRAVKMDGDGWTARTKDGSLSAHFEHSVVVTEAGARVLGLAA